MKANTEMGKDNIGKLMLENGEVFTGEHKFGKRDGHGIHIIPNKNKIRWDFYKDGKRHGEGIFDRSDGEKYIGNFVDAVSIWKK